MDQGFLLGSTPPLQLALGLHRISDTIERLLPDQFDRPPAARVVGKPASVMFCGTRLKTLARGSHIVAAISTAQNIDESQHFVFLQQCVSNTKNNTKQS